MLRHWLETPAARRFLHFHEKAQKLRRRRRFLSVEPLEDRKLLATFSVTNLDDAGSGSLRQAILDANSSGGADDIVFQTGLTGTIALTSGEMTISESVTITGNGASDSVIDAQQASRIFRVTDGDVSLDDLTLTNGSVTSGFPLIGGAVLFGSAGTLSANRSVFANNSAAEGGAIYGVQGPVIVSESTLTGNSAQTAGGAIFADGDLTVRDSTLSDNSALTGGAISADLVTIQRSTFNQNTAQVLGGAISANDIAIENSTLSENTATGDGGAIYVVGPALVTQTTFFVNVGSRGGALYAEDGPVDVLQSTFDNNISNNANAFSGNAIFSESSPLTIRNSIVASPISGGRSDVQPSPDVGDAFVVEYSLIGKNTGTTLTPTGAATPDANGNLIGDSTGISAGTAPLADNGGPTMTNALLPGSPALDRGDNAFASGITSDQRGMPFARVFGGTVDMGAFELQDIALVVDTDVDEDDDDYSMGDLSLREAIRLTNANPGTDAITFDPTTDGADFDLTLGLMTITDSLTITGNGAANTVIDAQQLSGIFEVGSLTGPDVTMHGVSLVNGMSTGQASAINSSGTGTLTLSESVVSGNTGGAISHQGALHVTRSTLSGNSGAYAGGTNSGAAIFANGAVHVTESTLSGNVDGAFGGAIAGGSGGITVTQSTLTGNTGWQGGAIHSSTGTVTVTQSTVTGNTATGFSGVFPPHGGGIYSDSATVTIRNSIVAGNADDGTAPDVRPSPDPADALVVEFSLIGTNTGTGLSATGTTTPDANGNLIGDAAGIDPMLAALADNGGPTQTRALFTGSPAINRGSNTIASPFMFDQRGAPFVRILDGAVNMGAVEAAAPTFRIIDDGDPAPAYTQSGDLGFPWTNQGFQGDVREMISDGKFVTYTFDGLNPGDIYDVSATWTEFLNRETQAAYQIDGAATSPVTVLVDQTQAPDDFTDVANWERLGTFEVGSGGSLVVTLAGTPNRKSVIADAVRIDLRTDAEIEIIQGGANLVDGMSTVDFGMRLMGSTFSRTFTIKNIGADDLVLTNVGVPSGFVILTPATSPIPPGGVASLEIGMDTSSPGSRLGVMLIDNNDADESPFGIILTGEVVASTLFIDDGDPEAYSDVGNPTRWTQQGFIGTDGISDVHEAAAGGAAQSATYTFPGMPAGTYRISATWTPYYNRASNAPYTIDGGAPILVNQKLSPSSTSSTPAGTVIQDPTSGIHFADLDSSFSFAGGDLTVSVSDDAANGNVIFDAVRLELLPMLQVDGHEIGGRPDQAGLPVAGGLTTAKADRALSTAIGYWTAHDPQAAGALASVQVIVKDLPADVLGLGSFSTPTIWLDDDAAGYGWTQASGQGMDLLSVVTHELGHVLGLPDLDPLDHHQHVMGGTLRAGVSRVSGVDVGNPLESIIPLRSVLPGSKGDWWNASDAEDSLALGVAGARRSAMIAAASWEAPNANLSNPVRGVFADARAGDLLDRHTSHRRDDEELAALDKCFALFDAEPQ